MRAESPISKYGSQRSWALLSAAVLVAVTLLACLPAMRGGFFWDDYNYLVNNPLIEAPDALHRLWLTTEPTEYLPLTYTIHWFELRLLGNHPAGYHVINVLLHAAAAVLLWKVLRRLGVPGAWLAGLLFAVHPVAAASAAWIMELKNVLSMVLYLSSLLLFLKFDEKAENLPIVALRSPAKRREGGPVLRSPAKRGEGGSQSSPSVAPRSGAKEGLPSDLSAAASAEAEASAKEGLPSEALAKEGPSFPVSHIPAYFLSLALFLFALLAKTSVVMLPVVLLLCAWWRRGRISRKDLLRSVPFLALSLALGLVTLWFQKYNAIHGEPVRPEGFASRLAASGWIAWFYLFKLLLPVGLCPIYPRWNVEGSSLRAFLPLFLLAAGTALLLARRKSWGRAPLLAAAYFLITLLPVLGFVDMGIMTYTLAADHLQYAAMIGVIAFAAGILGGPDALSREFHPPSQARNVAPALRGRIGSVAAVGCAVVLGALTWRRASLYGDERSLWQDNVNKSPAAWMAWNNLGSTYSRAALYEKAIPFFAKSLEFSPNCARAYNNRAIALSHLGRYAEALNDFSQAIALNLKPDLALACINRAGALAHLGRYAEALDDCNKAVALKPDGAWAYDSRFGILAHLGRYAEALDDCNKSVALKPADASAYDNRAGILARLGRYPEALDDCNKAIALKPADASAYNNRAVALTHLGRYPEAVADCDMAAELTPGYAEAFLNRAVAHVRMGRLQLALDDCDQAISLKPNLGAAYDNRGKIYFQMGRYDQAIRDYDQAIRCAPQERVHAPGSAPFWCDRGKARAAAGRLVEAIRDYDEALRWDPDFADAYYSRGNARARMDPPDYGSAISDYNNAIRLNPSKAEAFYNRGTALALWNRHEDAVQDYSKAIALNPGFADAYCNRATSYFNLKQYPEAWSDVKMSEKLGATPDAAFLKALTRASGRAE